MPVLALLDRPGRSVGPIGTAPAFLFVTLVTIAVSLAMYPVFVRYTPIGWILNGKRERPRKRTETAATRPAEEAAPEA